MHAYEPAPAFYSNVGQVLSVSGHLEPLRRNVGIIDMLSFRPMNAFDSSASLDTNTPGYYDTVKSRRIWRGKILFATGMTSLVVTGTANSFGSSQLKIIYNNGASSDTFTPTASWTRTLTLTGYTDGQMLTVEVQLVGTVPSNATYTVTDVYATPIVRSATWPGVPTFSTVWDASKLAQLGQAIQWCYDYMIAVPQAARRMLRFVNGPFKDSAVEASHGAYPLYYGGFLKSYSQDQIRVKGQVYNQSSPGLRLNIYNQSGVTTSSTWGVGVTEFDFSVPFSAGTSVGSREVVALFAEVTSAGPRTNWLQSKWTFDLLRSQGSYPYVTLPASYAVGATVTAASVQAYLNALSTATLAVYNRITGAPHVFDRARAMRTWYGYTDNTQGNLDLRARPQLLRSSSQILVRGRNVGIAWGAVSIPTDDAKTNFDGHTFGQTKSLIDADKTTTQKVYLDTIENLFPGTLYELTGDVDYAAEIN